MKWARAAPPEYHRLPTGFIDNTIAFQTARNADRFTFGVISCDQSRIWPRTESLCARNGVWGNELNHAQSISTIGHERKLRCVHATDLNCTGVVQRTTCIEHLVDEWSLWILNVDDRQALGPVCDIAVSARNIQAAGI